MAHEWIERFVRKAENAERASEPTVPVPVDSLKKLCAAAMGTAPEPASAPCEECAKLRGEVDRLLGEVKAAEDRGRSMGQVAQSQERVPSDSGRLQRPRPAPPRVAPSE